MIAYETAHQHRGWPQGAQTASSLEEKYEVMKEIGDGSFGSVALARVRTAGAHIARRGTLVRRNSFITDRRNVTDALKGRD